MRFPHEAYAKMVASEKSANSRQVAKNVAVEKQTISESAIEDDVIETPDEETVTEEDESLVD